MKKIFLSLLLTMALGSIAYAGSKTDSTLTEYTGRYVFQQGSPTPDCTIGLDGENLYVTSSIGSATMTRIEKDKFTLVEYGGTAEFARNEAGKIISVRIKVQDIDVTGTKEAPGSFRGMPWHPLAFPKGGGAPPNRKGQLDF